MHHGDAFFGLGVVFGPTLMRVRAEDMGLILNCNVVVEALITHAPVLFNRPPGGPSNPSPLSPNLRRPPRADHRQPPPRPAPCRTYG